MIIEKLNMVDKKRKLELQYFWLVVVDTKTGEMKNAYTLDEPNKDELDVVKTFESKNKRYKVIDSGKGVNKRPEAIRLLPFID